MILSELILKYWQFGASIIAVGLSSWRYSIKQSTWQALNDKKISDLETSVATNQAKVDALSPILITLQTDMASVKTSLEFIKGSIIKNQ